MVLRWIVLLLAVSVFGNHPAFTQDVAKYWVYFTDKGPSNPSIGPLATSTPAYQSAMHVVSPRALARRARVLPPDALLDVTDLPVHEAYVNAVQSVGGILAQRSRWMNAASFQLTSTQRSIVRSLPFVVAVTPVVGFHGQPSHGVLDQLPPSIGKPGQLDYGPSLAQAQAVGVPEVHQRGITGRGVLVGFLDTGFRWRAHDALRMRNIVAEHDFIFDRDTTANGPNDAPGQDSHGTLVMSVVAGYASGSLVGIAFDADFILAKTEDTRSETQVEEDNWAAALEWMESRGVDVVSSSLGYDLFDDGNGYRWDHGDFDGRTSVTAQAALRAARLGVVVCTAMGNEGNGNGVRGTMITPADADSIVSVGAVTFGGQLASFSSTGPTNDGRTKPDVVAPGVNVYGASVANSYGFASGTSLATPIVAGAATLLLSTRPEMTPVQVRNALRSTATPITDPTRFPTSPNNFSGWGLINVLGAIRQSGPYFSNRPTVRLAAGGVRISTNVESQFGIVPDSVRVFVAHEEDPSFTSLRMTLESSIGFPTSGLYSAVYPGSSLPASTRFFIRAADSLGHGYTSPSSPGTFWTIGDLLEVPATYSLSQNFPNPFNGQTIIRYELPVASKVELAIYNVLGQRVQTLIDGVENSGTNLQVVFHPQNLPSGVYFYRITTPSFTATRKMVLIR
jgi:serine protease AprX